MATMIGCSSCGATIAQDATFCATCGARVPATAPLGAKRKGGYGLLVFVGLLVVGGFMFAGGLVGDTAPPLTEEALRDVADALEARAYTQPTTINTTGAFVVVDYEVQASLAIPHRRFGQDRLLVIREALLPHGYKNFRVNVNGPPPGTGLIQRYGSARYIDGGEVEWLTP